MQIQKEKDKLWHGLPAIFYKSKYIIFSYYSRKIISLTKKELIDEQIFEKLKKEQFFGTPLKKPQSNRLTVMLYLTDACNLKCIYCFDDSCPIKKSASNINNNRQKVMSPELAISQLKKIIKHYQDFIPSSKKIKLEIHFFGGEPTLAMNTIKKVVEFLKKEKIDTKLRISTNGVTKEENLQYLIDKKFLLEIACDGIPEIHDKQRPSKAGFKSSVFTERMIKLIVKNKTKVRTKVVVTKDSTPHMLEAVEYLAKLGISHIRLEPVLLDGRAETNQLKGVNIKEFVKMFIKSVAKARELSKKYKRRIWISNRMTRDLFNPSTFSCQYAEGNTIILTPEGNLSKCVRNIHSDESSPFVVGKIKENNFYLNKNKLKTLNTLSVNKMDKCKNCFAKYICSGDCINENYESSGSLTEPKEKNCEINKAMIHNLILEMYEQSKK